MLHASLELSAQVLSLNANRRVFSVFRGFFDMSSLDMTDWVHQGPLSAGSHVYKRANSMGTSSPAQVLSSLVISILCSDALPSAYTVGILPRWLSH